MWLILEGGTMRLAVIAARSGSKGLVDKNIKPFAGRPLLAHTVAQAIESGCFDRVAVSSDSDAYLRAGEEAGADLLIARPLELANDIVGKPPVLRHALRVAEAELGHRIDILVDLQPTSPLRRKHDIRGAVTVLEARADLINVVSVSPARASPYYTLVEERSGGTIVLSKEQQGKFVRRQDLPPVYELNGSIYVWRRESILEELPALTGRTGYWTMPDECNFDIDTSLDFDLAAFVAYRHFGWPMTPLTEPKVVAE